jgi:putative ABC transport system permease protein
MIKNYFKISWRNLRNNKVYSLINITGLSVGLISCLLVATVVVDELSYDKYWKNADNLYRIIGINKINDATEHTPNVYSAFGPELKMNFPEVVEYCRMQTEDKRFKLDTTKDAILMHSLSAESTIWNMLDFSILEGDPKTIIEGYDNIVITEKIKDQYFPNSNPIGKKIYDVSNNFSITGIITGVIKDIPENTHLRAQVLVLRSFLRETSPDYDKLVNGYGVSQMPQYLLLAKGTDRARFVQKINTWYEQQNKEFATRRSLDLQPFTDVYLRTNFNENIDLRGNIKSIYAFTGIAILLLLIACINYMNLTTARALKRIRESGIRKILGARRKELITQFLFESLLFFIISFTISCLFYGFSIQPLESYLGHNLALNLFNSFGLFTSAFGMLLLICLLTGFYPAYALSGFKSVDTIKGNLSTQIGGIFLRKALITIQFTISIAVLLCTMVVYLQLQLLNTQDLGYDKSNLLQIDVTMWGNKGEIFKNELLKVPGVERSSISWGWYPSSGPGAMLIEHKDPGDENKRIRVAFMDADIDFAATLKLQLQSGRLFNPALATDGKRDSLGFNKVLVSDTYVQIFNSEINKPIEGSKTIPIGVIKNFHNETLLEKEKPFFIGARKDISYGSMLIRIKPNSEKSVIAGLQGLWKKVYPEQSLSFNWVEDLLAKQYKAESRLKSIFIFFALLTIFLACLGLFGLITFTVEQRTKEIGIRKVLGAPVIAIVKLISKDYVKLVFVAIIISSPIAGYFMNRWLQDYPYRIEIQWWMFVLAGALSIVIALFTISFQTVKAAISNPVNSLRSE